MSSTRITRHVNAPRARVYRALLDGRAVATWMVPTGMTSQVHAFDPREGGKFRISLTYDAPSGVGKTTAHTDTYHGHFVEVVPNERVVEVVEFETADPALRGVDYSGELISKEQTAQGIEPPVLVWVPSIAPSGFALYLGDRFPSWKGDFFVGGLAEKSLRRVRMRGGEVVLQEVLLRELKARIRDVRSGPDGFLYVVTDDPRGSLLRLRPKVP